MTESLGIAALTYHMLGTLSATLIPYESMLLSPIGIGTVKKAWAAPEGGRGRQRHQVPQGLRAERDCGLRHAADAQVTQAGEARQVPQRHPPLLTPVPCTQAGGLGAPNLFSMLAGSASAAGPIPDALRFAPELRKLLRKVSRKCAQLG